MSRWRPGDVALVRNRHGVWNRAICTVGLDGDTWRFGVVRSEEPVQDSEAHPLAVFDPEDWALMGVLAAAFSDYRSNINGNASAMQAAVQSLITPPKPEEPTGLGAVVETTKGRRYVRWAEGFFDGRAWAPEDGAANALRWDHLDAVKVLSEGVTP